MRSDRSLRKVAWISSRRPSHTKRAFAEKSSLVRYCWQRSAIFISCFFRTTCHPSHHLVHDATLDHPGHVTPRFIVHHPTTHISILKHYLSYPPSLFTSCNYLFIIIYFLSICPRLILVMSLFETLIRRFMSDAFVSVVWVFVRHSSVALCTVCHLPKKFIIIFYCSHSLFSPCVCNSTVRLLVLQKRCSRTRVQARRSG